MATQTQTNAANDAAAAGATAHKDGVEAATTKLLDDTDVRAAMSTGSADAANRREYTKALTENLVAQNLLPAVSVGFLEKNFEDSDLDGDSRVDINEMKTKRDILGTTSPGSLDGKLYAKLYDMMKTGELPESMTREEVRAQLEKINENWLKQDRANALEVAKMLDSRSDLLRHIDVAGHGGAGDGIVHIDDLNAFLKDPPHGLDQKTIDQLTWLRDNWNSKAVKEMKNPDGNIERNQTRDTLGTFIQSQAEAPKPRGEHIPEFGSTNERGFLERGYHDFGRPDSFGHSAYYSDGNGYTVAIDRAKDDPNFDPSKDDDPNQIVGFTVGMNGQYEGWKYDRERKVWTLYRDAAAVAEADDIRMDIDGQLIRRNVRSLIPDRGGD